MKYRINSPLPRSTRSEQSPSPRAAPRYASVGSSTPHPPPSTPPLARTPHRHSLSHPTPSSTSRGTVIAVTTPPGPPPRARTVSRERSGERDSGNPSPDVTQSEALRSSPGQLGSESDSRSAEFDSLSVDDSTEETGGAVASTATTVIHVTGNSVTRTRYKYILPPASLTLDACPPATPSPPGAPPPSPCPRPPCATCRR